MIYLPPYFFEGKTLEPVELSSSSSSSKFSGPGPGPSSTGSEAVLGPEPGTRFFFLALLIESKVSLLSFFVVLLAW